jgi:protein OS-9
VTFPDEYILESHAEKLLQAQVSPDMHDQNNPQVYMGRERTDSTDHTQAERSPFTYEEMMLEDRRHLCQIPRVTTDDHNTTRNKADSQADEQKELARATDRGIELLREMEGQCMYYFSGWWSYSFCYQKQIKQFHALPAGRGIPHYPPIEDTTTHSFILGKFIGDKAQEKKTEKPVKTDIAELHTKGGSRYLVQHLRGGTKCDLTGRERKVEVQFHCHPQSTDHIGWIKELTTCSYLMVIYTPRLCDDVAFLPPQQDEVHNIECREILMPEEVDEWEALKERYTTNQLAEAAADAEASQPQLPIIGGIEVGGHRLVGMEGKIIEKGRVASSGEERVEVVAKRVNGEIGKISKQILKKYDLDQEKVEEMKKLIEEQAEGKDWTLEVVESNGVIKFQGVLEEDEDDIVNEKASPENPSEEKPSQDKPRQEKAPEKPKVKPEKPINKPEPPQKPDEDGSEETFKDEL